MADGTLLYKKSGLKLYPISDASVIDYTASEKVKESLDKLWSEISNLQGTAEASGNIVVNTSYAASNSEDENEIKQYTTWSDTFYLPQQGELYIWKKTTFTYKGNTDEGNTVYEIVYANVAESVLNIYIATSTGTSPKITYPILTDGYGDPILDEDGNEQENLAAFDDKLPEGWSETPVSITPATPYTFIATRKKVNGKWLRYSEPAQFGRWAFDSLLELRYRVSDTKPDVDATLDNPGNDWAVSSPEEFTGKLWMITATSVNGVINADSEGVRWKGPNLMAIIQ